MSSGDKPNIFWLVVAAILNPTPAMVGAFTYFTIVAIAAVLIGAEVAIPIGICMYLIAVVVQKAVDRKSGSKES